MTDVMDVNGEQVSEKSGADDFARRYGDLVYAAALRQVGEAHVAADVMQGVFVVMIRKEKEGQLPDERFMAGWLLRVTHYVVKEMRRGERLRVIHERKAAEVRPEEAEVGEEEKVAVLERLDEVLLAMRAVDREVIARRYLRSESVGEVAAALGMTENTASKRIARALGKLRTGLARRGVRMGVTGIAGVVASQALVKTPVAMAGSLGGGGGVVTAKVLKGVIWRLVMAKAKVVAGVVMAGILLGGGTTLTVWTIHRAANVESNSLVPISPMTQGAAVSGDVAQDATNDAPEPTELSQRYSKIFRELDEKQHMDQLIDVFIKSSGHPIPPDAQQHIVEMQIIDTIIIWSHMEEATIEVARRHGVSTVAINEAPSFPLNPLRAGIANVQLIIRKRMVIPLDDSMAQEVVDLANARYAQAKVSASQP